MEDGLLEIGKVVKPHGIRGKVRVVYYGDSPETLTVTSSVVVRKAGKNLELTIRAFSAHKKHMIVSFDTIDSFDKAKALAGGSIFIQKASLPRLPDDEYYWFDLIGCTVVMEDGSVVGRLSRIIPTGSNDVYVVEDGKREILIPATVEAVREVDTRAKRIIVYSPGGAVG